MNSVGQLYFGIHGLLGIVSLIVFLTQLDGYLTQYQVFDRVAFILCCR